MILTEPSKFYQMLTQIIATYAWLPTVPADETITIVYNVLNLTTAIGNVVAAILIAFW